MKKKNISLNLVFIGTILSVLMLFILILSYSTGTNVYAATDEEELINTLNLYKDRLGDLQELKKIIDQTYNDLNSATTVNDELKQKLNADIAALSTVPGMDPLICSVLQTELTTQVNNLTDENIDEMKNEVLVIKKWVDEQLEATSGGSNSGGNQGGTSGGSNSGGNQGGTSGGSSTGGNQGGTSGGSSTGGNQGGTSGGSTSGGNQGGTSGGSSTGGNQGGTSGGSSTGGSQGGTSGGSSTGGNQGGTNGGTTSGGNNIPDTGIEDMKLYILSGILLISITISAIGYKKLKDI